MMNPCRASITLGRYTRLVSPWPSLPASVSHNINIKPLVHLFCQDFFEILSPEMQNYRLWTTDMKPVDIPLSPPPKDHTVLPSWATAMVWELPQATWPTPLMSFTNVGVFLLWLSLWPAHGRNSTSQVVVTLNRNNSGNVNTKYVTTKMCTKSAKISFSPGIKLSIISHSSTVSVASRRTNNNLTEIKKKMNVEFFNAFLLSEVQWFFKQTWIAYFTEEWPLDDFGVFLGGAVAMTQFSIFSISPAKDLGEIWKLQSAITNRDKMCWCIAAHRTSLFYYLTSPSTVMASVWPSEPLDEETFLMFRCGSSTSFLGMDWLLESPRPRRP